MKQYKHYVIRVIVTLGLLLSVFSVAPGLNTNKAFAAESDPKVIIGTATGEVGATVDIPVSITNNSGIYEFGVFISYDSSKLRLTSVTDGTVMLGPSYSYSLTDNPYILRFDMSDTEDTTTANGVIATLAFEILPSAAPGFTAITVDYNPNEIKDNKAYNVFFEKINGGITIPDTRTAPSITSQPSAQSVTAGQTATFTVTVGGNPAPTLRWQCSTDNGSTWSDISGATSATLTLAGTTTTMSGNRYRCIASNSEGIAISDGAALTVTEALSAPSITSQPSAQSVTAGQTATFTVTVGGNPAPTLRWQCSTDNGSTWSDISGATSATLTLAGTTTTMSGNRYRCVASNSEGIAISNGAALTVTEVLAVPSTTAPSITNSPSADTRTPQTGTYDELLGWLMSSSIFLLGTIIIAIHMSQRCSILSSKNTAGETTLVRQFR